MKMNCATLNDLKKSENAPMKVPNLAPNKLTDPKFSRDYRRV